MRTLSFFVISGSSYGGFLFLPAETRLQLRRPLGRQRLGRRGLRTDLRHRLPEVGDVASLGMDWSLLLPLEKWGQ